MLFHRYLVCFKFSCHIGYSIKLNFTRTLYRALPYWLNWVKNCAPFHYITALKLSIKGVHVSLFKYLMDNRLSPVEEDANQSFLLGLSYRILCNDTNRPCKQWE